MTSTRTRLRGNGEGSASPVKDEKGAETGRWKIRVSLEDPATRATVRFSRTVDLEITGRRTEKKVEKAAEAEIAKLRAEKEKELAHKRDGGDGTLRYLAEAWLKQVERADREPSTLAMYRRRLDNHILPRLGHLPANEVGARELDRLYGELLDEKGLAPSTVETIHTTVMAMLRQGKRWKMITELPEPTPPRGRPEEQEPPTPAQVQALVDKAKEQTLPHIALLIRLAALTGARRGELCGLKVQDLDWDAGALTIERQLRPVYGEAPPKGQKGRGREGRRLVALGPALIAELQDYLGSERQTFEREPGPWLLSMDGGRTPLYPSRVSDAIKRLGDECGVKVHTHSLRHFHDTYLAAGGIDDTEARIFEQTQRPAA